MAVRGIFHQVGGMSSDEVYDLQSMNEYIAFYAEMQYLRQFDPILVHIILTQIAQGDIGGPNTHVTYKKAIEYLLYPLIPEEGKTRSLLAIAHLGTDLQYLDKFQPVLQDSAVSFKKNTLLQKAKEDIRSPIELKGCR